VIGRRGIAAPIEREFGQDFEQDFERDLRTYHTPSGDGKRSARALANDRAEKFLTRASNFLATRGY